MGPQKLREDMSSSCKWMKLDIWDRIRPWEELLERSRVTSRVRLLIDRWTNRTGEVTTGDGQLSQRSKVFEWRGQSIESNWNYCHQGQAVAGEPDGRCWYWCWRFPNTWTQSGGNCNWHSWEWVLHMCMTNQLQQTHSSAIVQFLRTLPIIYPKAQSK